MSKQIELSQGKVAIVDDADFERINAHKWYASKDFRTGRFYALRHVPISKGIRTMISMHHEVMNAPKGTEVDHIHSDDTLDNRRSNLRICTTAQNQQNRGKSKNNTSGYKGVCWHRRHQKWQADIAYNGTNVFLGRFNDPKDAARAYNKAALRYHGEFARLNEI